MCQFKLPKPCHIKLPLTSQSTSSQHLNILRNAGIVTPVKYGAKTCYNVTNEKVKKIIKFLEESENENVDNCQ